MRYWFILLPLGMTVLLLATGNVLISVSDDITMMRIAESFATNPHSEHLVFVSVLLGYPLRFIYKLIPAVNWYVVILLVVLNAGFVTLGSIVKRRGNSVPVVLIFILAQILFLSNLTFTSVSFVGCTAALMYLFDKVDKLNNGTVKPLILGGILLLISLSVRNNGVFTFVFILFLPALAFGVYKKRKTITAVATIFILCVGLHYSVSGVSKLYQLTIPEETYYNQFQEYRSAVLDNGNYTYSDHVEDLESVGLDENDHFLLFRWIFADKFVFSADVMKNIAESRTFKEQYNTDIPQLLKSLFKDPNNALLLSIIILEAISLFVLYKTERWEVILTFLCVCAAIVFLYFRRRGYYRITNAVFMCGIMVLPLLCLIGSPGRAKLPHGKPFAGSIRKIVSELLAIFVIITGTSFCLSTISNIYTGESESAGVEYIREHDEYIFVNPVRYFTNVYLADVNTHILRSGQVNAFPSEMLLSTWSMYSSYYYDLLERLGLSEYSDAPIFCLLDERVKFVVSNKSSYWDSSFDPESFVKYFKEHYRRDVAYESEIITDTAMTVYIYDFRSE